MCIETGRTRPRARPIGSAALRQCDLQLRAPRPRTWFPTVGCDGPPSSRTAGGPSLGHRAARCRRRQTAGWTPACGAQRAFWARTDPRRPSRSAPTSPRTPRIVCTCRMQHVQLGSLVTGQRQLHGYGRACLSCSAVQNNCFKIKDLRSKMEFCVSLQLRGG